MMNRKSLIIALSIPVVLSCFGSHAFAQSIPSSGQVLQDLQKKTVPSEIRPDTQRQKAPESNVEDTRKPTAPSTEVEAAPKKVKINAIDVEGVTLLDPADVNKLVAPYENKEDTFADLQELTDKLTNLYREKGYVTSRVYIPPQKLQQGSLKLQAAEGHMGDLVIKEGKWFKARSVKYGFTMDKGDPFNANTLKRNLRQLNENPDRNARAILKPGEKTGDTDVQLQLTDRFPFHVTPSFDNLGRRLIGDNRVGLRLADNNLLGFGDSALSSLSFTRRSWGIVNHYQAPIGSRGTKLGFDHAYSHLKLGEEFKPLDVQGNASTYSPFISQDIWNRERYKLNADLAFDFKQLDTNILGSDFNHDQLRILRPGINFEEYDATGRTFMRHEIGWGLDVFGGTSGFEGSPSRAGAGTKFFRYTGSLIRTQKLPWNTFGVFRLIGQASPDRLVSSEQFQAGGAFTVRGYREGEIVGDNGILLSGEWRIPFFLFPKTWKVPHTDYNLRDNVQLVTFLDFGSVSINKPIVGQDKTESVLGTGVGVRFKLTRLLNGRVDLAFPLLNQPDISNARIHFGLESNLF